MQNPFFGFPENGFFWAAKWIAQKRCRIVEYPFRRRTTVRQRRISAREKVKYDKMQATRRADCLPTLKQILSKSSNFHKCLFPKKYISPSLFRSALFRHPRLKKEKTDETISLRPLSPTHKYNEMREYLFQSCISFLASSIIFAAEVAGTSS